LIGRRGLKVQEYECGKKLVTREARFGAKIALVKENVFPSDLTVRYNG
jgi:hypothetical protein